MPSLLAHVSVSALHAFMARLPRSDVLFRPMFSHSFITRFTYPSISDVSWSRSSSSTGSPSIGGKLGSICASAGGIGMSLVPSAFNIVKLSSIITSSIFDLCHHKK